VSNFDDAADGELIAAARTGSSDAFRILFDRCIKDETIIRRVWASDCEYTFDAKVISEVDRGSEQARWILDKHFDERYKSLLIAQTRKGSSDAYRILLDRYIKDESVIRHVWESDCAYTFDAKVVSEANRGSEQAFRMLVQHFDKRYKSQIRNSDSYDGFVTTLLDAAILGKSREREILVEHFGARILHVLRKCNLDSPDHEERARLIGAARSEFPEAWQILFERYDGRLRSFFRKRNLPSEDLAQQTWIHVVRALPRYEEQGQFVSWLFRIARNSALDFLRCNGRRPAAQSDDGIDQTAVDNNQPEPEESVLEQERRDLVHAAIGELPSCEREVIIQRKFEDKSLEEMGQILGITRDCVRQVETRALESLHWKLRDMALEPIAKPPLGGMFLPHALDSGYVIYTGWPPNELLVEADLFDRLWSLRPSGPQFVTMHGKPTEIPRRQLAVGADYPFSNQVSQAIPTPPILMPFLEWARREIDPRMNGQLLNFYDGPDEYIGQHNDAHDVLFEDSPIVTITLGEERKFRMRPNRGKRYIDIPFPAGSFIIIPYHTNLSWKHEIPKSTTYTGKQISITIRAFTQGVVDP